MPIFKRMRGNDGSGAGSGGSEMAVANFISMECLFVISHVVNLENTIFDTSVKEQYQREQLLMCS